MDGSHGDQRFIIDLIQASGLTQHYTEYIWCYSIWFSRIICLDCGDEVALNSVKFNERNGKRKGLVNDRNALQEQYYKTWQLSLGTISERID